MNWTMTVDTEWCDRGASWRDREETDRLVRAGKGADPTSDRRVVWDSTHGLGPIP